MTTLVRVFIAVGMAACLMGCVQPNQTVVEPQGVFESAGEDSGPVSFILKVDPSVFDETATIKVEVMDSQALSLRESGGGCSPGADGGTVCHDPEVKGETWTFTRAELAAGPTVTPKAPVMAGERFWIGMSGKMANDCQTLAGSFEGVSRGVLVTVREVPMLTSRGDCPLISDRAGTGEADAEAP